MPGAVTPYERLRNRPLPGPAQGKRARKRRAEDVSQPPRPVEKKYPQPTDPVFPGNHIKIFNNLLNHEKLKLDRDGHPRTAYSLRHTYICLRLMEGANINQVAKNCRTSVEMIERHYAAHTKNTLDAVAISIYYHPTLAGYQVVITAGTADPHSFVRFVSTLTPGQDAVVSVPRGEGQPALELRLRRVGDRVELQRPAS